MQLNSNDETKKPLHLIRQASTRRDNRDKGRWEREVQKVQNGGCSTGDSRVEKRGGEGDEQA